MYQNGLQSVEGRGRGRGRGRGLWRPLGQNSDVESGRGLRVGRSGQSRPSQGKSPTTVDQWQQNISSSQQTNCTYHQYVRKEDWRKLSLLASSSLPTPNSPRDVSSASKTSSQQQLTAQSPPSPRSPYSVGRNSSSQTADSHPSQPKSLLTLNFSPPRRPLLPNPARAGMDNNSRPDKPPPLFLPEGRRLNFRNQLKNVRSQLMHFDQCGGRFPVPQEDNSSSNMEDNSSQLGQQRRANKRPVNSASVATDVSLPQKNIPRSGPQNKKKKRKKKSESEPTNKDNKNKSVEKNADLAELEVDENKNFEEQTEELIAKLEQTDTEKKMRSEVLKDVEDTFSPYLPCVEAQIYGSTLTNIAFKSSDLDIYLYCPKGQPEYNFVLEKGKLMYKSPKFTNIVRVPRARVPVIKAVHVETNIDVDISTMSGQAVYNSLLIKRILSMDNRLRPLAMLISLWSKLNTITGHNRFTSYSVVLMILYYLQKITPSILPPLKEILYSNKENDWPNFFNEKSIKNENTSDIAELFKGFFVFYRGFNFEKVIISPYLGEEIPVSHFINIEELSDDFSLYKSKLNDNITPFVINNVIHVQDPIEHNVNASKGVFPRLLKLFRRSCERLLQTCNDRLQQNRWLPTILKQAPLIVLDEKTFQFIIDYPFTGDNWFEKCRKDFRKLLEILLIRISEDEFVHDVESNGGKQMDSFFAESNYNVFNKKFRNPLRMYLSDTIPLRELQKQFEIVVNRIQLPAVSFKSKFTLEELNKNGSVKVTITDKNTTALNSFLSVVNECKRYYGKFLVDIASNNKSTEDSVELCNKEIIMKCDNETKQKPIEDSNVIKEKDGVKDSQQQMDC